MQQESSDGTTEMENSLLFKAPDMEQKGGHTRSKSVVRFEAEQRQWGVLEVGRRTKTTASSKKGDSQGQAGGFRRGAVVRSRCGLKRKMFTACRTGARSSESPQVGRL